MAFDKTQITNRALVKLGSRPVTDVDLDDTVEAETARNLYDMDLEELLAETLWTFATKRATLALLAETIVFNNERETLAYIYQKPNDVIRIFETSDTAAYWKEEEDTIVSDTSGLGIKYVFRNENPATYPSYFAAALADKLAASMAFPLLNSTAKTSAMIEFYEKVSLPKAQSQNAQIGTPKELNDDYWLNARSGGPNVQEYS